MKIFKVFQKMFHWRRESGEVFSGMHGIFVRVQIQVTPDGSLVLGLVCWKGYRLFGGTWQSQSPTTLYDKPLFNAPNVWDELLGFRQRFPDQEALDTYYIHIREAQLISLLHIHQV